MTGDGSSCSKRICLVARSDRPAKDIKSFVFPTDHHQPMYVYRLLMCGNLVEHRRAPRSQAVARSGRFLPRDCAAIPFRIATISSRLFASKLSSTTWEFVSVPSSSTEIDEKVSLKVGVVPPFE